MNNHISKATGNTLLTDPSSTIPPPEEESGNVGSSLFHNRESQAIEVSNTKKQVPILKGFKDNIDSENTETLPSNFLYLSLIN